MDSDRVWLAAPIAGPKGVIFVSRPGPIPSRAIEDYGDRRGFDAGERELLLRMVRVLDDEYRRIQDEKIREAK